MHPALSSLALSLMLAAPSRPITLARAEPKTPNEQAGTIRELWNGTTLSVAVRDVRAGGDPTVVGAQQLKDKLLYEWKAAQPVPDAVRTIAEDTLKSWEIAVSPSSPLQLELAIRRFYVDEVPETFGSSYRGEVEVTGRVIDADGARNSVPRTVRGSGKSSGPDKRAKLCNEALTVALEDAIAQIMTPLHAEAPVKPGVVIDAADEGAATPKAMLKELLRLKDAGVGEQVLLGYVRQRRLTAPLTVEDILTWKVKGLPESVIHAAQEAK